MRIKIKPRLYQEKIFAKAVKENTLVVLPTGLGKTLIALMLALHELKKGRVLVLAPTKPLVEQHLESFTNNSDLKSDDCALVTGALKPEERGELYDKKVVFATPQTVRNDLITRRARLEEFSLIVFDECHRAVGNYAYCFIASEYEGRVIGLSASPGSDADKIKTVCKNLGVTNIEARTENDPDVKPYLQEKKVTHVNLEIPDELGKVIKHLKNALSTSLKYLKDLGLLKTHDVTKVYKKDLLALNREARAKVSSDPSYYKALSLVARALKVMHAQQLLQTQGVASLKKYFNGLKHQSSKAAASLLRDRDFQEAMHLVFKTEVEHPKFNALLDLISPDENQLVFTQYRATAELITSLINDSGGNARVFVGQRGAKGMTQKEQLKVLEEFRKGEFNTLVSTSISEEGLDIPSIDTAVFFEPVPSALRMVQRKGRVGRAKTGKVYVLVTKGTVDEKYKWIAYYKEKRMKKAINNISREDLVQSNLKSFM
ncbi:DEAD/DEAH box helicase [archaeon]|nr:DEAD/DEAH box helicase [archaeon]